MIELLPEDKRKKNQIVKKILSAVLVIFLVGGLCYLHLWANRLEKKNTALAAKLDNLSSQNESLVSKLKESKKLRRQENALDYFRLISDLKLIVPSEVGLEEFKLDNAGRLRIKGRAVDNKGVSLLRQHLREYSYFQNIGLVYSEESKSQSKTEEAVKKPVEFRLEGSLAIEE